MKAIIHETYGSADVLQLKDVDRPEIADDEVLVRVHAAGVDRGTWHVMTGLPYPIRLAGYGLRAPKNPVLGMDLAGVVEAVGSGVSRFGPGDEVFGMGKGSYAEYAAALEGKLAPKPANLGFEQAAVIAASGLPALQGLRDHGKLRAGQSVLIIGASGGVGTYAVQLAKAFGAQVTGVCSTAKVDMVRSIGADHVIDYTREDFAQGEQRYDLILDIGRQRVAVTPAARARPARGRSSSRGGETGGRWLGGTDRQIRAIAAVALREPAAGHVHLPGEPRGHDRPQGAHRSGEGHAGHRPELPAERGPRGDPLPGAGEGQRQGRHRRVRRDGALGVRGETVRQGDGRELDGDADVELGVVAAGLQVLVQQVLELEAPDERVALDAAVGEIAAGDARALAVGDPADAPAGERARIEPVGEHLGDVVEGQEARSVGRLGRIDEDADDPAHLAAALPAAVRKGREPCTDDRLAGFARRRARERSGDTPEPSEQGQTAA